MAPLIINKIGGLNTQPNELEVAPGSLAVAENVEINRDGVVEVARGFEDFSENLPDFRPEQLIVSGGVAYLHLDNGIWYFDTTTSAWLRKRGAFGTSLSDPRGVAYSNGHLYATTSDNVILDINLSTGSRSILAGRFGVSGHVEGTGGDARFSQPSDMVVIGDSLYVSEVGNHCIRRIVIATGVVTTPYGTTTTTSGHTDGVGNAARFFRPRGLVTDGTDLYVADEFNSCIRKVTISTGNVTTPVGVAAPGTTTGHVDDTGNAARFQFPSGLAFANGNLYVADTSNNCIRRVVLATNAVTTPVGTTGVTSGHIDDTGNAARFNTPIGVCVVGGSLYVSEEINNCIRRVVLATNAVTTPVGTTGTTAGHVDAIGNAARFDRLFGIATDGTDLFTCDYNNDSIRKVYVSTSYASTIDGFSGVNASSTGLPLSNGIIVGPS